MSRAVFSGSLRIGGISIPVGLYKSHDRLEIECHRYHESCGGKIKQEMFCEEHPEDQPVEYFSAICVNDELIPVDKAVKQEIFDTDVGINVISSHKVNMLRDAMFDGTIIPTCAYYMKPKYTDNFSAEVVGGMYHTLLHRLKVNNLFLLMTLPVDGMNRYAALTHAGVLMPFCYDSEIRQGMDMEDIVSDPAYRDRFNEALKAIQSDMFPAYYSSIPFYKRIEAWMKKAVRIKSTGDKVAV